MNFEYLLTNLKDGICEPLYGYNQYILKRFFEGKLKFESKTRLKIPDGSPIGQTLSCE